MHYVCATNSVHMHYVCATTPYIYMSADQCYLRANNIEQAPYVEIRVKILTNKSFVGDRSMTQVIIS